MLGLVRLQIAVAAPLLAAGAADHLMQQLERALGRARIAVGKTQIGVDDADEIELGKMMTLGDELRADDDVEAALRHVVQFLPQPLHGVDQIARQHQDAGAGKQLGRLLLQPLDAGTDRDEAALRLALRALLGRRHRVAAVVADQPPLEAVIDQPGVAVRTGHAVTAGVAQGQRREAAAIEEQQRLLAALQRDLHRLGQSRRDEASARRRLAPQIDGFDRGQMLAAEPFRQMQMRVAAALGVHHGLDRRRGGGEHDRNFRLARAHHRHVAGVIAHAVLLLVGRIVLLIDDDQTQIGIRQKQRRARADHHRDLARRDRGPGARALSRRDLGMPFRRTHAEALGEAVEELRGERDLRHQDQDLLVAPDRLGHRLEIHFGLARAGDAIDQRHREAALRHGRAQAHRPRRAARR